MTDLNVMMREQARAGLQAQLDAAVTNGDTDAARKVTADLEKLAVSTAPKAPPYGDVEIRTQLEKAPWFGVDPKRSAKAVEFGKTMDPKKFATAEAFADALIKAVDEEFAPAAPAGAGADDDDDEEEDGGDDKQQAAGKRKRATDAPGEGDSLGSRGASRRSGPWTKLSEAPREIQAEIKRQADKFVPANATKERRDTFISKALESHYMSHQRTKGK